MESNFDVSPAEASQNLAAVEADQTAIRTAAKPPRWYNPSFALCLGVIVVVNGVVPDSWIALRIILLVLICVAEGVLFGTYLNVRNVKVGLSQSLTAKRVPIFIVGIVTIAVVLVMQLPSVRALFPWWAHVCIGAVLALLLYLAAQHADK